MIDQMFEMKGKKLGPFAVNRDEDKDGCTCVSTGPRGGKSCPACLAFHAKYFPAWPGEPAWRLNHGAIDRNSWGIVADAIPTRNIEAVSDLQIEAAERDLAAASARLAQLRTQKAFDDEGIRESKDKLYWAGVVKDIQARWCVSAAQPVEPKPEVQITGAKKLSC